MLKPLAKLHINGLLILLMFCSACSQPDASPDLKMTWNAKHTAIKFVGLSAAVVGEIKRDTAAAVNIYSILPVCKMPADTSLKNYQPAILGLYDFNNDTISFKPDTPFVKDSLYFARYYRHNQGISLLDMIKGHKKPGAISFKEWIFKY